MNHYTVYYESTDSSMSAIPIACETNLAATWNTIADSDMTHLYVKDSDGKAIACFKNCRICAIVDQGATNLGINLVNRENKRQFDASELRVVK